MTINGITLFRIRALIDIPGVVNAGVLGGFIESESSLSHFLNAWVSGNAWVFGEARVSGEAWVSKTPIFIQGLRWKVLISDAHMAIGCQCHTKENAHFSRMMKYRKWTQKPLSSGTRTRQSCLRCVKTTTLLNRKDLNQWCCTVKLAMKLSTKILMATVGFAFLLPRRDEVYYGHSDNDSMHREPIYFAPTASCTMFSSLLSVTVSCSGFQKNLQET